MPRHAANPEIHLLDGQFYARGPHPHFRWMRENAPVYWDEQGGVWGVALHADVMAVSKDSETFCNRFSSRPDSPPIPSMINLDDPQHKRRRNLVNRGFTPRRVAAHEPRIRQICRELIARIAPSGRCDFVRDLAAPLPMIVIGDLLGVTPEDRDRLLRWSDDLILGTSSTASERARNGAMLAFQEYSAYHGAVVSDRRARPGDDLVSVLLQADIDGEKLSDEELLQESLLILVGGDETTRHVISAGMRALIEHPDQRALLVEDPRRIPAAVEEMLRWATPIQNMCRTATRDVELHGEKIREGDKLLLLYPSANRDAAVFERPDAFDVGRDPNDHVAFGGRGTHFCLGAPLARLELRVMFEELLAALPDLELATRDPLPLRPSNFIVGIESMPVAFTPRKA
jgi:cytochrome P450 family 142 subfamily A polypeptide 1